MKTVVPQVDNYCTLLVDFIESQKEFSSKDGDKDQERALTPTRSDVFSGQPTYQNPSKPS